MTAAAPTTVPTCRFATTASDGDVLCHCTGLSEAAVREAVDGRFLTTVCGVMEATGAGTGCRACHCRIQRVLNGLPAKCGGRFDWCSQCGCIGAICRCEAA